jgi:hypothetical protein
MRQPGREHDRVKTILVACCLFLVAACAPAAVAPSATPAATATATATPTRQATATATATPTPTRTLAPGVRRLEQVGARAVASPDGKWIGVSPTSGIGAGPFPFQLFDIDGKFVRSFDLPTLTWRWLEDSSGIYVALDVPQRSPKLGIIELAGGAPRDTGLQMSGQMLSRDRNWIVAVHEEGCCASVTHPAVWATLRAGGPTRVVATAKSAEQGIAIFGIDARDRLIYRDAGDIYSVPVTGGPSQRLGTTPGDWHKTFIGTTSPDGAVVMVITVDPAIWGVVAGDRASAWPSSAGEIVTIRTVDKQAQTTPIWTADHSLLVRTAAGGLAAVNVVSLEQTPLFGKLADTDVPLAYRQLRLLIARAGALLVLDVQSNAVRETGIEIDSRQLPTVFGAALPGGGFIVTLDTGAFRID